MGDNEYQKQRRNANVRKDLNAQRDVFAQAIVDLSEVVAALAALIDYNITAGVLVLPEDPTTTTGEDNAVQEEE